MHVTSGGQGLLQFTDHIFDRPVLLAGDLPQRPPVVLPRFETEGVEEHGGGHVMSVGDEWHAHPGTDGLILKVQAAGVPPGPECENKGPGNGHAKGHRQEE